MRMRIGWIAVGLIFVPSMGCSRPAPTTTVVSPAADAAAKDVNHPKFESEVVHTGKGGQTTASGQVEHEGKSFTVSGASTTLKNGSVTIKYVVGFIAHRDGKDVYKVTYTVTAGMGMGGSQSREVRYDGVRTVLVEDEYGVLVLQPPAK